MQKKTSSLGRGLGALLSSQSTQEDVESPSATQSEVAVPEPYSDHFQRMERKFGFVAEPTAPVTNLSASAGPSHYAPEPESHLSVREIPVTELTPMKNQPRQNFSDETIAELAQSIRTYGILQPLIVSLEASGKKTIVAGERRWRAAKLAGLATVPCLVRKPEVHSELEIALIENIQREELSPVDEARTLQRLLEEHSYTQETLASKIGKERSTITNTLRLLSLPAEILEDLQHRRLSAGHARAICALDDKKLQLRVRDTILSKKLSVRQTEDLIKGLKKGKEEPKALTDTLSPDMRHLCDQFKGHLGTKVRISGGSDKGRIEISYYTLEDLERITELVLGDPLAARGSR